MATGRGDGPADRDVEEWEDERPRSLLNATWFRVLVVVLVIGAVAAVAVPYVMDLTSAPRPVARVPAAPPKQDAPPPAAPPAPTAAAPTAPAPGAPAAPAAPPAAAPTPAEKPVAQAPQPEPAKPAPAKPETAQPAAPAAKTDAAKPAPKRAATRQPQPARSAATAAPAGSGEIWVQVGAFRDAAAAQRLAVSLKEKGFTVAESSTAPAAPSAPAEAPAAGRPDRYDVVVSGGPAPDVIQKLTAKGLSAERIGDGAIVRPSLPLRDAVALSNDLRTEGFKVTVRRASGGATAAAPAATTGDTWHRVRVGAFPDRAAAREAVQKLEALGYKPFIARGP